MKVRSYLAMMAVAVLVPVVIFSALAVGMLLHAERNAAIRSINETARATSVAIDREWRYAEGVVKSLATSAGLARGDFESFYAQATQSNNGDDIYTALLDENAQQVLNTAVPFGSAISPPVETERLRIKEVLQYDTLQISNLIIGRATKKHVVLVELPVKISDGRRFVIAQWYFAEHFNRSFPMYDNPPSWLIGVFDREGRTIARNRGPKEFLGKVPKDDLLRAILSEQPFIHNQSRDGIDLYTVLVRSPLSQWTVAVGVPDAEIEAAARKAVIVAAIGLLAAIGLALGAAYIFGRRVAKVIDGVTQAAVALERGQLPAITSSNINEVDRLNLVLRHAGVVLQRTEQDRSIHLEEAQKAQALAESQNKAKDDFLAMLGHELRNPLSAITSGISLLEHEKSTPETARRAREVIRRQSLHLTTIVDELLDASRVMTGRVTLAKRRLNLGDAARACLEAFQARGIAKQYQVEVKIEALYIEADPIRLDQIINNLIENAFKYMAEGGRVVIDVHKEGKDAVLKVQDSGVGISAELLPKIFGVFVQAPATLDRSKGGLGIGLAVVDAMVSQHGGVVTAESAGENQGSCFTVRLPLAPSRAESRPNVSIGLPRVAEVKVVKILLIDDNDDAREMLVDVLAMHGYQTVQAKNGVEGAHCAAVESPEVVIIDIGLPDISGYEVARRLRGDRRLGGVKLIALTGYGQEADRVKAMEAGFDLHFTKPVDMALLLKALQKPVSEPVSGRTNVVLCNAAVFPQGSAS